MGEDVIMKIISYFSILCISLALPIKLFSSIASATIMINQEGKKVILLGDIHDRIIDSPEKIAQSQTILDALTNYAGQKKIGCILEICQASKKQLNELEIFGHTGFTINLLTNYINKQLSPNISILPGDMRTILISNVGSIFYTIYNYVELCKKHSVTIPETDLLGKYIGSIPSQENALEQIEIAEEELHHQIIKIFYEDMLESAKKIALNKEQELSRQIYECASKIQELAKLNNNSLAQALRNMTIADTCTYAITIIDELFESACKHSTKKALENNDCVIILCGHGHTDPIKEYIKSLGFKITNSLGQSTSSINNSHICSPKEIDLINQEIINLNSQEGGAAAQENTQTCAWCKTRSKELLRCARCKKTYYCNAQCQKNNWKQHKSTCDKL